MNNIILFIWLFCMPVGDVQQTHATAKFTITGTWQRDSKVVGKGLGQNFVFRKNGTFVLNIGNDSDDAVAIISLKGKYRIVADSIYFTILSRTIVEGELETGDKMLTFGIFQFGKNSKIVNVKELHPHELDPCEVEVISNSHIKINNEVYYRVKPE